VLPKEPITERAYAMKQVLKIRQLYLWKVSLYSPDRKGFSHELEAAASGHRGLLQADVQENCPRP
jgi:hypothetical protein